MLLLDVSGSMDSPDKLPLAVQSMELLLSSLKPTDTVGIVVYAGAAGTVLEPTPVSDKQKIIDALRDTAVPAVPRRAPRASSAPTSSPRHTSARAA